MEAWEAVRRIRELSSPLEPLATDASPMLHILPGIRAVLFDVYGTLLVSASGEVGTHATRDTARALDSALLACGLQPSPEAAARAAVLLPAEIRGAHALARRRGIEFPEVEVRDILRALLEALVEEELIGDASAPGTEIAIDPELCERLALEYECRVNPTWPMPGARRLLENLRGSGRVLGLVSNAQFYTPWMLAAHLGGTLQDLGVEEELCLWSYRLGEAKPSTAPIRLALGRLARRHIGAAEVACVGNDRRNDIATAAQVGCRTVLFAGDRRSYRPRTGEPGLATVRPDALITHLSQLPSLLVQV